MHDLSAVQGVLFVYQKIVLLGKISLCHPRPRAEYGFLLIFLSPLRRFWELEGINSWSEDSVYLQLNSLPITFKSVQMRRLIPDCFRILCTYTWEHFLLRLICLLLAGSDWDSSQVLFQKVLSLRQQQAPSCNRLSW